VTTTHPEKHESIVHILACCLIKTEILRHDTMAQKTTVYFDNALATYNNCLVRCFPTENICFINHMWNKTFSFHLAIVMCRPWIMCFSFWVAYMCTVPTTNYEGCCNDQVCRYLWVVCHLLDNISHLFLHLDLWEIRWTRYRWAIPLMWYSADFLSLGMMGRTESKKEQGDEKFISNTLKQGPPFSKPN